MVLAAFRRIPLPALRSHSQPADKTLIDFDTIFYTDARPLSRTITLLGQRVRLEITPTASRGCTATGPRRPRARPERRTRRRTSCTATPGPTPPSSTGWLVTWSARYSVDGGPLAAVDGTVTTAGPATPLRVAEASPALSGSGH